MGASRPPDPSSLGGEIRTMGRVSSIYFIGQAINRAVGFLMLPVYTRFIEVTDYGAMEMIDILVSALAVVIAMNVGEALPRFYYAEKDQGARNEVVSTTIIGFGLLALPLVFLFFLLAGELSVLVLDFPRYESTLRVATIALWFAMLCELGFAYLRMRYMARTFVAITVLQLALQLSLNIYFVVYQGLSLLGVYYSTLIGQGLTAALLVGWILRQVRFRVSPGLLRRLVAFGLPLVPSRIGLMVGFVSNRFFIRWHGPQAADPAAALALVGQFSLGHKFGVVVNRFVTVPFNSYWGPRRLELLLSDEPDARRTAARICTFSTLGSVYFALLVSAAAQSVIEIMAAPAFRGSHGVVPLVALAYVALGLETHFSTGLLHAQKTTCTVWIAFLALAVVLLWNWALVPVSPLWGAATSNLAGFAVRSALTYGISQRLFHIPFELGRIATLFAVAAVLYLLGRWIDTGSAWWDLFLRAGLAGLFPLALVPAGFYRREELESVMSVWKKFRKGSS